MANETTKVAPATKVKAKKEKPPKKKQTKGMKILTVIFSIISVFYVAPVFIVLMNSFKTNAGISKYPFALPNAETFYGLKSYITGMFFGNFPFDFALHINVCMVFTEIKLNYLQNHLLLLHFLNGSTFPDGYVYSCKNSRQPSPHKPCRYSCNLPRFRCRSCGIYVLGVCKINSD